MKEMKRIKKMVCIVVVLVLAVSIMSLAASATVTANASTITGQDVNLRSGPGSNYDSLGMFDKGDKFECIGPASDWTYGNALKDSRIYREYNWCVGGYVKSEFLDPGYLGPIA